MFAVFLVKVSAYSLSSFSGLGTSSTRIIGQQSSTESLLKTWKMGEKSQKTFFSDMKYILALVVKISQSKVRFGLAIVLTYR